MGTLYEAVHQYDGAKSYEAGSSFKNINSQHKLAILAATQKNIPHQGNRKLTNNQFNIGGCLQSKPSGP